MKKYTALILILALALTTAAAAWMHLSTREDVAAGTLQMTVFGRTHTVNLSDLDCAPVSGVRINGKGESIPVEGSGIPLKNLLTAEQIASSSKVTVIAGDSYNAVLTAEELNADGKAYLLLQEDGPRLIVFGDENSKRSITNVVQIIVESLG